MYIRYLSYRIKDLILNSTLEMMGVPALCPILFSNSSSTRVWHKHISKYPLVRKSLHNADSYWDWTSARDSLFLFSKCMKSPFHPHGCRRKEQTLKPQDALFSPMSISGIDLSKIKGRAKSSKPRGNKMLPNCHDCSCLLLPFPSLRDLDDTFYRDKRKWRLNTNQSKTLGEG